MPQQAAHGSGWYVETKEKFLATAGAFVAAAWYTYIAGPVRPGTLSAIRLKTLYNCETRVN